MFSPGKKIVASINTAFWRFRLSLSMSTRRENEYPLPNPSKWPSWHWFTEEQACWEKHALFIMLAQPHYVYGYGEPPIKISICANDRTIPSGLLCPLNRPIFQLWRDDQSVFFHNLIIFVMLIYRQIFFPLPSKARPINMRSLLKLRRENRHFQ